MNKYIVFNSLSPLKYDLNMIVNIIPIKTKFYIKMILMF